MLHRLQPAGPGVEDPGVVRKIVADDEVGMTVAVQVGQRRGIGEPTARSRRHFPGHEADRARGPCRAVPPEERDRRPAPVIDQDVHQAVFVQVARQTTHGGHRVGVVGQRHQVQREGLVSLAGAGHRSNDDPIDPRVHVDDVVGQAVPIQVVECNRRADRRDPGLDPFQAGMDRTDRPRVVAGEFGQRMVKELESSRQPGLFGTGQLRLQGEAVERQNDRQGHQVAPRGVGRDPRVWS